MGLKEEMLKLNMASEYEDDTPVQKVERKDLNPNTSTNSYGAYSREMTTRVMNSKIQSIDERKAEHEAEMNAILYGLQNDGNRLFDKAVEKQDKKVKEAVKTASDTVLNHCKEAVERKKEQLTKNIDGHNIPHEDTTSTENKADIPLKKVREYKNVAKMPNVVYRKPKEIHGDFLKVVITLVIVAIGIGIFIGVQSLSYYNYTIARGKQPNNLLSCTWSWLGVEELPIMLDPFYVDVFMYGFCVGAGLFGFISLLIYVTNDMNKQSRVGHEHGRTRLATPSDFKKYKKKFMDR